MFERIKNLWRRLFGKVYTKNEVMVIIGVILEGTYDRKLVDDAMLEIDRFDAGAIDIPLRNKIMEVLRDLKEKDEEVNREKLKHWWANLR